MITFIIGLAILVIGGMVYGRISERIMAPTDATTPAVARRDNMDFVPIKKKKNCLIELLNIAGTGPILGPLQGALFGPIAFITIPIGCVIGGAFSDYMTGMMSVRNNGDQMPGLVRRFLGKHIYVFYNVFMCLSLLLVGAVFVYMPGDLFVTHILNQESSTSNPAVWIVYGAIFVYYILATLIPIDKIIGKFYPVLGAVLLLSTVGIFIGLFLKGYPLVELWDMANAGYPYQDHFIPIFFVTVTCGLVSGFHAPQVTLVSRTISHEKDGRSVFYNMMIVEGFIAMVWAAAGIGALELAITDAATIRGSVTQVVGIIAKNMLGEFGGIIAIIGIIILPITTGDTSLRSLRLIVSDVLHIDNKDKKKILIVALCIFAVVAVLLVWAKSNPEGFNILWRYFSWANETIAFFGFTVIAVYMKINNMPYIMALIPGAFYMYIISCYILSAKIGFNIPWNVSYVIAGALTVGYFLLVVLMKRKTSSTSIDCTG